MNINLSLEEIASITGGKLEGYPANIIDNIIIDSRKFITFEKTAFAAIKGERHNGHDYIKDLVEAGILNFIIEEEAEAVLWHNVSYVIVKNTVLALQKVAAFKRQQFPGMVVGITGSNGKTVVKEWIHQAIAKDINIIRSPQSYNSQVGVPLSLFLLENKYDIAIIEAGISKPREMENLRKMIQPEIGIMTNLGEAHQENFTTKRDKLLEKLRLFSGVDKLIYCGDYKIIHEEISERFPPEKIVSWGMSADFDYYVSKEISMTGSNIHFEGKVSSIIQTPYRDFASIENCIHVIIFLYEQGYSTDFIRKAVSGLDPVSMRMEILKGSNNCTIINDSYNSDLVSLSNALDYLELQVQHNKKTLILSDIFQSGQDGKELYSMVAGLIRKRNIDRVIAIGETIKEYRNYFSEKTTFYQDTDVFLNQISNLNFSNEAILLKGSRKFEFERISHYLQESAHRTVLEIDLSALLENYRWYRSKLKPGVKMMVMVKAFSYGSGGYEIASILQYQNVEYLAVAYADEGVGLRKNGIDTPIMVMSPGINDFNLLIKYNLEPEIYSFSILDNFESFLKRNGIDAYPVHMKIDTGMHRLGFSVRDMEKIVEKIEGSSMRIVSVFSHLAASDEKKHDDYTRKQLMMFREFCSNLQKKLGYSFIRHILNTSGIERFPDAQFEMVRLGIGLYGVSEFAADKVSEISTFKTRISQIKDIDKDDTVGYSRAGKVDKPARIATIPVGYADGIRRTLGKGVGKFMINHQLAPLIGNVCMDMCMLDITGLNAREGDEVIIFGKEHSVKNLAKYSDTIAYEILTGISRRVKRIYYQE